MERSPELSEHAVLIRCDGSPSIGMGHVVRMTALARALVECKLNPQFVTRTADGAALDAIASRGFEAHEAVNSGSDGMLSHQDARALAQRARCEDACVIVDHYGAHSAYFSILREHGIRYGVIDDLADRDLRGAHWVLNPAPGFVQAYGDLASHGTAVFAGPEYALLRPEFARKRSTQPATARAFADRVLITLGGAGGRAEAELIRDALAALGDVLDVRYALGSLNAAEMADLMAWADVAVSAAGQTGWELACIGVPAILVRLAENQRRNAAALEAAGCAVDAGAWDPDSTPQRVARAARSLLHDDSKRRQMSGAGRRLIDGAGATRAAQSIARLWWPG